MAYINGKEILFSPKVHCRGEFITGVGVNEIINKSVTEITSDVASVGSHAFYDCKSLVSASFPNATDIGGYAFQGCEKLTAINAPNALKVPSYCHDYNMALSTVNYPKATTIGTYAFRDCFGLTTITKDTFPNVTTIYTHAFERPANLVYADFPKLTSIKSYAFSGAANLKALVLRSPTFCELENANAFEYCTKSSLYIYVPADLYTKYTENLSSNNWKLSGLTIRVIEFYTDDGTINGNITY